MSLQRKHRSRFITYWFVCFAMAWLQSFGSGKASALQEPAGAEPAIQELVDKPDQRPKFVLDLHGQVTDQNGGVVNAGNVQIVSPKHLSGVKTVTNEDGQYKLRLELNRNELHNILIRVENGERTLLSYAVPRIDGVVLATGVSQLDVPLFPSREIEITVVDENQFAVDDASVCLLLGQTITLGPYSTGKDGILRVSVHASQELWTVMALKKQVGLSCWQTLIDEQRKWEPRVRLVLEKAQPMRVQLSGADKKPVIGARVGLSSISTGLPGRANFLETHFDLTAEETDDSGEAWLDAFPFGTVVVGCFHPDYESYTLTLNHNKGPEFVHQVSLRNVATNRCRVLDEAGNPLVNTRIEVEMLPLPIYQNRIPVRTDDRGILEFSAVVGKPYMLTARTDGLGAAAITGFGVEDQGEQEMQDLQLKPLRKIGGTVRLAGSGQPVSNRPVYLMQLGAGLEDVRKMRGADAIAVWARPILFHYAKTDAEGHFQFAVPDGEYNISLYFNENHSNRFRLPSAEGLRFDLTAENRD
ncbi:MAG: hypothetical protein MUC43_02610 [Pirellula sp.]|nr:hypothetical protein [Pirellula sp.]